MGGKFSWLIIDPGWCNALVKNGGETGIQGVGGGPSSGRDARGPPRNGVMAKIAG